MADSLQLRVRRLANRALAPFGLHLARTSQVFDMDGLLARAASRGTKIATWIDVGASDGSWSLRTRRHFPSSRFLLFEPLAERQPALAELKSRHNFHHVPAAAGRERGIVEFSIDPALDGSGVAGPGAISTRSVPVETIDHAVAQRTLTGPFGVKLDTHGFEIPILEGATTVLAQTDLLIIEAYNFTLVPGCLRFPELCAWLEVRGFRCCDLADPMRRPGDGALWQMDLAFVRTSNPVFDSNGFR
jgi:FkbM family methyltransferase